MEKIHTSPVSNYIQRNGFVMVSNLLIDHQQELGISETELCFIIKIMKHKSGFCIHDRDLDPTVSEKTVSRRRMALKEKGLLNYSVIKKQDPNTGRFATEGVSYDLSPLEEKLQIISDRIEAEREKEAAKYVKDNNLTVEPSDTEIEEDNSPIAKYKKDYKNTYKVPYIPSEYELQRYDSLDEEEKKMLNYIFDYCSAKNLLGKIVPRLSLFFKTTFRFNDLKDFCVENGYINNEEEQQYRCANDDFVDNTELIRATYLKYFDDVDNPRKKHLQFYNSIERIINYRCPDGQMNEVAEKFINISYEKLFGEENN